MGGSAKAGDDWNDQEIDLIVADYFAMLNLQLNGEPYVKARHNAALQKQIERSKGSIEFKYQNISAVLEALERPWIPGYKPKRNFQQALLRGVEKFLERRDEGTALLFPRKMALAERGILFVGKAPQKIDRPEEVNPELARLVRKFDPALRDERNRQIGRLGEECVFNSERDRLATAGRPDLAEKVKWVARDEGDGAGFDVLSFTEQGEERFLEVKTTVGSERTPFYISRNEKLFSEERRDAFRVFRLYDFARAPKAFEIEPPLENSLVLETVNYKASFR
ncbi:MAG: DUF3883 domain-containing protein [Parvibaculum sp.]|uniref:DUF3883 domain-containing protein n=1 Tax=Alphaproteobacteria TaxID=28211 RepID=UPI003265BCE9